MNAVTPISATDLVDRKKAAQGDWLRALQASARIGADPSLILPQAFDALLGEHGSRVALIGETETFTFAELADRSNRYARWAIANGLAIGDVVGLMMENRPEHVAAWLGLTRVGVIVALVNPNLVGAVLARCIAVSAARHIIAGDAYAQACNQAVSEEASPPVVLTFGSNAGGSKAGSDEGPSRRMDLEIAATSGAPLGADERRDIRQSHRALYIFTSGTTGNPKAAVVSHRRVMHWAGWFNALVNPAPSDRMYHCLPMYHSLGAVVAVWTTLLGGGSVAIRERFSAKHFWSEVAALDCSIFQYIGEMCRYLVNAPAGAAARRHRLRLVIGNGLRSDIWQRFLARFAIPRVIEFYAATESNFSLYNLEGEPGAIGRIPPFVPANRDIVLVTFDHETVQPARFDDGHCRLAKVDEPGEALSRIILDQERGNAVFEGYLDGKATDSKILRDVFKPGDAWMRSGDLMRKDARGFYCFVDRIGDTFRWKGENVATSEVAEMILAFDGIIDVNVSGVSIPGNDGRAGLAALVVGDDFDLDGLKRHLDACLPSYARPLFIQIRQSLEVTETFKHTRRNLALDQVDPLSPDYKLYVASRTDNRYVPVDPDMHRAFVSGDFRF